MQKLTVALLSGGKSSEREVSLNGGNQVYEALDPRRYRVLRYDPQCDLPRLTADAPKIDVALIVLHGPYGEDGTVQGMLDLLDIPYQGAGVLGSALAMNKLIAKQMYERAGLPTPSYLIAKKGQPLEFEEYVRRLGLPLVVKPVQGGSSIGMSIVRREENLAGAIETALTHDETVLIEAYIEGLELTGAVLGNRDLTPLPIVEIIPTEGHDFFNYKAKYTPGATQEICPARISDALTQRAQAYAGAAHRALSCLDYSRTDMILHGEEIYVLETNTIPGMTQTSLLPLAAKAAGISFSQLLDKLIKLCMERHAETHRSGLHT